VRADRPAPRSLALAGFAPAVVPALALALSMVVGGCGPSVPEGNPLVDPAEAKARAEMSPEAGEFNVKLSTIINDLSVKYQQLSYKYDEELLAVLDRVEARLAGKTDKLDPLPLIGPEESEQLDHFRESIRRWEAKTKKTLRAELDPLLADVAARKPTGGPLFHPDFHKKFSAVFDDFIPIEVQEMRERRNRKIHEAVKPLIEAYRDKAPAAVKFAEDSLNATPYALTPPAAG
jgi:hypothetical protein